MHQVKTLHDWLDGKRQSRQAGCVVGESRTGKTVGCDAYRLRHKLQQVKGQPPTVPVVYIQILQECGAKEFFGVIIEHLKYQITKGTVAEIRDRTYRVLKGCGVEMLIIDEADRFKPKTFAEVRDIFEKLEIAVILVGTDRLDAAIKRDEQVYNRFRACHRFGKLSSECPNCKARFAVPALWVEGACQRCFTTFGEMAWFQKVIEGDRYP